MQHESLLVLRNPQFWYLAISNNCTDKNSVVEHTKKQVMREDVM